MGIHSSLWAALYNSKIQTLCYKTNNYLAGFEDIKHELQPFINQLFVVVLFFNGDKFPEEGLYDWVTGLVEGCP